ncbi:hypothetical protein LLE49_07700 [Alicyclobacillus tolerans]|uniref:YfjL-like protein n=1 Tax=Alicyclobacillus tolerans TaxID=90970 RepID=UPI001F1AC58C|nr:hypothetical protein [Alicyclobacillus tolerans]MCF8564628.1 hypothetical protein [Alicyclobacillus tolerans]
MTGKKVSVVSVTVIIFLAIVGWIYVHFNGTPWGKSSAEQNLLQSLQQEYQPLKYHVVGNVGYNFKDGQYNIAVTFNKVPNVKYVFELNSKSDVVEYVGTDGTNVPTPVPHSTQWVNSSK